jgi:hypothetical protein
MNKQDKAWMMQAGINAAKIGLLTDADSTSTQQSELIYTAATRLAWYELRIGFEWGCQRHDWESQCQIVADYITTNGKAPSYVTLAVLMMT